MDYHIETVQVLDAFKEDCECPLCLIRQKLDSDFTDTYLGGAAMSPDYRLEVNKLGFCARHFKLLYDGGKRLPLALHQPIYKFSARTGTFLRNMQKARGINAEIYGYGAVPLGKEH